MQQNSQTVAVGLLYNCLYSLSNASYKTWTSVGLPAFHIQVMRKMYEYTQNNKLLLCKK